ncbi:hypothetical protein [Methylosinus sp. Ce-a6]|uniref:hypothetical protein n=1 Tax=Methylosinus sp. Ce-a6 TaxID=2172005 RepID=UPI001FCEC5F0|nr:hypothetical protein [Methylosinus sp. Ce-a6]
MQGAVAPEGDETTARRHRTGQGSGMADGIAQRRLSSRKRTADADGRRAQRQPLAQCAGEERLGARVPSHDGLFSRLGAINA